MFWEMVGIGEMSDMTLVQLMNMQRERELREQRQPGHCDWLALPFVCMFVVCAILCMSVAGIVAVILGLFCQPDTQTID